MRRILICMASVLTLLLTTSVLAFSDSTPITYSGPFGRYFWNIAAASKGKMTNIGFEGIAPRGGLADFTSTGLNLSGAHFDSFSATGDKYLLVVDSDYPNTACGYLCYQWNSGAVLHGPPEVFGNDFGFPAGIQVNLPSSTYAVGTDLWTILPQGARVNVQIYGAGWGMGTYIDGGNNPNRTFIGFTSEKEIIGFRMFASTVSNPGPQGGPYADLDNFSFARVPEPVSLLLFGSSTILLAAWIRRRQK